MFSNTAVNFIYFSNKESKKCLILYEYNIGAVRSS